MKPTLESQLHIASRLCPPPRRRRSQWPSRTPGSSKYGYKWKTEKVSVFSVSGYTPRPGSFNSKRVYFVRNRTTGRVSRSSTAAKSLAQQSTRPLCRRTYPRPLSGGGLHVGLCALV